MPEPRGQVTPFPKRDRPDRRVTDDYTFQGSGSDAGAAPSVFGRGLERTFVDDEALTQNEQFDDVQAHLDTVDFQLQQDRVLSASELQRMEHVLTDAKQKLEAMRRNPMVTKELVQSVEIKYNMLRQLLDEHYAGNVSDVVPNEDQSALQPRSTDMRKAA